MRTLATIVSLAVLAGPPAARAADATDGIEGTMPPMQRSFSYILGVQTGNNIRKQLPTATGDIDLEAMMQGIRESLAGEPSRLDVAEITFWSGKFLKMLEDRRKAGKEDNLAKGNAFRDEYAAGDGVTATSSGVLYKVLIPGEGRQPGIGQSVTVHYEGRLTDGTVFDSSRARGAPATLRIREVIPGWQEVLTLMPSGSRWEAVVPPELAYGESGTGKVGPNETLIFDIELISIE